MALFSVLTLFIGTPLDGRSFAVQMLLIRLGCLLRMQAFTWPRFSTVQLPPLDPQPRCDTGRAVWLAETRVAQVDLQQWRARLYLPSGLGCYQYHRSRPSAVKCGINGRDRAAPGTAVWFKLQCDPSQDQNSQPIRVLAGS
jgi:hypothetical protein